MQDFVQAAMCGAGAVCGRAMLITYAGMFAFFAAGVVWQLAYAGRTAMALNGGVGGGATAAAAWVCLSVSLGQALFYALFALWMARAAYRAM